MLLSCQFIYPKLEKAQYQVKLIEKQGKVLTTVLSDQILDLNDEMEVSDGVRLHMVNISKKKNSATENISHSIFSPTVLVIIILMLFQWKSVIWAFNYFMDAFVNRKSAGADQKRRR